MSENKSQLINFAMNSGLVVGVFWVIKYFFVIAATGYPFLGYINTLLSIGTPLLLFFFLVRYKNFVVGEEKIGFWHGIQFSVMLFFFASLLEAIIVIVHIVWLDPAYLSRTFEQTLALVESMSADQNMISKLKQQPIPCLLYTSMGSLLHIIPIIGMMGEDPEGIVSSLGKGRTFKQVNNQVIELINAKMKEKSVSKIKRAISVSGYGEKNKDVAHELMEKVKACLLYTSRCV